MKLQQLIENRQLANEDQLDEIAPLIPIALHGARIAAPHIARFAMRKVLPKLGRLAKHAIKNPIKTVGGIGVAKGAYDYATSGKGKQSVVPGADYEIDPEADTWGRLRTSMPESDENKDFSQENDDMLVELLSMLEEGISEKLADMITEKEIEINDDDSPAEIIRKIKEMLTDPENFESLMAAIVGLLGESEDLSEGKADGIKYLWSLLKGKPAAKALGGRTNDLYDLSKTTKSTGAELGDVATQRRFARTPSHISAAELGDPRTAEMFNQVGRKSAAKQFGDTATKQAYKAHKHMPAALSKKAGPQ